MKVPNTFVPEKNLDEKTKEISEGFHTLRCLIEKEVEGYWKEREYYPDPLITDYKHIKSAVECANIQYANYWEREVSMTIFKMRKPAKDCMEEINTELEKGLYEHYRHKYCLVKHNFVIILKTLNDANGMELFKKYYQEKFGFC